MLPDLASFVLDHPVRSAGVCVVALWLGAFALLAPPLRLPRRRPRTTGSTIDFSRKKLGA